jgi:uncharacterized protein (TIGR03437 family)
MDRRRAALLLLLICQAVFAQKIGTAARQRDLDFVGNQLPLLNPNFFSQLSQSQFQQALADLNGNITSTTDAEFYTMLAQVVALAGDAHTVLHLDGSYGLAAGFQTLPLSLVWLDDGVFVTAALVPYAKAVGTQLVAIGGTPIDKAVELLATVISHENDQWVHYVAQTYLTGQQILQGLHIAPAGISVPMTFRNLAGEEFTLDIAPGSGNLAVAPDPQTGFIPDVRRSTNQNYWFTYSLDNRLLYFKYNVCEDDPGNPFLAFSAKILAALDANPVDTFVWDLRGNTGGDTSVIRPLGSGLFSRLSTLSANPRFRIYVVIDKGTFSAALTTAIQLEQPAAAALVQVIGEPTGGKPQYFGNVGNVNLPGSLLVLQYSTVLIQRPPYIPDLPSLMPAVPVSTRSTDFFARFDPVMAAMLARNSGPPAPPSGAAIMVNGASFRTDQGVAPGSYASVFGAFSGTPDQLLIGGLPATLIGATSSQVNVVVPATVPTGPVAVSVRASGAELANGQVTIAASGPGVFILNPADPSQPGAVENQDYSVNAAGNAASAASVVQLFATGYGPIDSQGHAPVQVFFGDSPATVLFSGPIAQYPGLWQVNVQVPAGLTGQVPVFLIAAGMPSNGSTIYLH